MAQPRNYAREYDKYHDSPLAKKRRAQRNKARRLFMRMGKVHKGDGLDIDHRNPNRGGPLSSAPSNLRVMSRHKNRGRNNN